MAQSDISIQVRTGSRWGARSGSVSGLGPWDLPSVPVPGHRDPSSAADESAASRGAPASPPEEGFRLHSLVAPRAVLSAWRGVERELNRAPVGSVERQRLSANLACLRETYHKLFDELRRRSPLS